MLHLFGTKRIAALQPVKPRTTDGAGRTERSQPAEGCFDQISLSPGTGGNDRFHKELVARLSQEVRTYNTTGKIQELRQQVASGEYQPNAQEIAARMLLTGEVET